MKYKGYTIFKDNNVFGKDVWSVGTIQEDGRMVIHASGFPNYLTAKRAADAHFGIL